MDIVSELQNNSKKFNKIIIWGFRTKWHTHRFIFQAYYENLKKCDIPVIWVDDDKRNVKLIEKGDLIFSASNMYGKMVPKKESLNDYNLPIRDDVFYCLHAENDYFIEKIPFKNRLILNFYSNEAEKYQKIYEAVHFDAQTKTLYQPWGTDLVIDEFKNPVFRKNKFVFWVGSVWRGSVGEGNINRINELIFLLNKRNLKFIPLRFIPNFLNQFFIRQSRIAPAIGGDIQIKTNYLPCRMFKNISYGQLGFSNIRKFNDIFKGCNIYNQDIEKTIDQVLSLNEFEYLDLVKKQQEICKRYTIVHHLNNVFKLI